MTKKFPLSRPIAPKFLDYAPYLEDIKAEHIINGKRPLASHLETRFEKLFSSAAGSVATMSSGITAFSSAIRALAIPKGAICLIPSWISPTILSAVVQSGLEPYFIDVEEKSWGITPQSVKSDLIRLDKDVGLVIFSAPFDINIDVNIWDNFTEKTGVPVIIDAAASFDSLTYKRRTAIGKTPIVLDFNIYNLLAVDEGGLVVSQDTTYIQRIKESNAEGFYGRQGQINEYMAAVFHAALDNWEIERSQWKTLTSQYIESFIDTTVQHRLSFEFVTSVCNIYLLNENANEAITLLAAKGIEARKWWGDGCHMLPDAENYKRAPLPVTKHLTNSVIGIPFYIGIPRREVEYVARLIHDTLYSTKTQRKVST